MKDIMVQAKKMKPGLLPFLPQNAIVGPGTQVAWFNGDVGHEHNIVVRDANGAQLFETGEFDELEASRPITFNITGDYEYADTVEYESGFVMTGNIRVIDQDDTAAPTPTPTATFDTVGALMVPSMDVQSIVADIEDAGFGKIVCITSKIYAEDNQIQEMNKH